MLVQRWENPQLTSGVRGGGEAKAERTSSHPSVESVLLVRTLWLCPADGRRRLSPYALRSARQESLGLGPRERCSRLFDNGEDISGSKADGVGASSMQASSALGSASACATRRQGCRASTISCGVRPPKGVQGRRGQLREMTIGSHVVTTHLR